MQRADVFIAGRLPATSGVGIRATLVLVPGDRMRLDRRTDVGDRLLGAAAVRRGEHLRFALRRIRRLGEGDPLGACRSLVGREKVGDLLFERDREWVLDDRGLIRTARWSAIVEDSGLTQRGRTGAG